MKKSLWMRDGGGDVAFTCDGKIKDNWRERLGRGGRGGPLCGIGIGGVDIVMTFWVVPPLLHARKN